MKIQSHIPLILVIMIFISEIMIQAQNMAPQGFNYQAIARDFNGQEMENKDLLIRIKISSGESGTLEWQEIHSVTTNKFGLFSIIIGQGSYDGGRKNKFPDVQWGSAAHYLEVDIDFKDSRGYLPTGKSQLFSVPYALYANYAANGGSSGSLDRQNLAYTDSSFLLLINNDGTVQSSLKNDFDPTNEIQDLLLTGNILKITNNPDANEINLSPYLDNTDKQTIFNRNDSIGISNGNTISLKRFYQNLSMETDSLRISNGNAVSIAELKNPASINFYAEKTTTSTVNLGIDSYLVFNETKLNTGDSYSTITGNFAVPFSGLYSFYITYEARNSQGLKVFVNNGEYDYLVTAVGDGKIRSNFILYLIQGDVVNIIVNSGGNSQIGKATWAGFKVY